MKPIIVWVIICFCILIGIASIRAEAATAHDQYESVAGEIVCIKGYSYIYAPISDTYVQMFEIVEQQIPHGASLLTSLPIKCK